MSTTYSYGTWNGINITVEDFRGSRFLDVLMHAVAPNGFSIPAFDAMDDTSFSDHGVGCVVAYADVDGEEMVSGRKIEHTQIVLKTDWVDCGSVGHAYCVCLSVEWDGDGSNWSWGCEDILCVYAETMDYEDENALYRHLYDVLCEIF